MTKTKHPDNKLKELDCSLTLKQIKKNNEQIRKLTKKNDFLKRLYDHKRSII